MSSRTINSGTQTNFLYTGNMMASASDGETFSLDYDENGNLIYSSHESPATSYEYNWDNKLRSAEIGSTSIGLKYDPLGNRIYKNSSEAGARKYIVDVSGRLPTILCEIDPCDASDPNGSLKYSYIYTPGGQILAQQAYNAGAEPNEPNDLYFYIHDRLGSVRLVINDAADVNNSYTYSPSGEMFASECTETVYNPFLFTGQWWDPEIRQYYLRARMYDPRLGIFTSRDPVMGKFQEPLALHVYLYCMNNPVNYTDLSGKYIDWSRLPLGLSVRALAQRVVMWIELKMVAFSLIMYDLMQGKINIPGVFRGPEYNAWKSEGIWQEGWHFHLPWGPGLGDHHLPQESLSWWNNFNATFIASWESALTEFYNLFGKDPSMP
jgi:RHS repeat-associated protein